MFEKYSLIGVDGNAFSVMGYVRSALKKEGLSNLCEEYSHQAMSSDYSNLLCVSMDYIEKCNKRNKENS
jgi:hypothetical protein